jgi:hypothetical protein
MILTIYTCGGLGNLLFMIANAYNLSKKNGYEMVIYDDNRDINIYDTKRKKVNEYNIFKNFKIIENDYSFLKYTKYNEPEFKYNKITLSNNLNYNLCGYYQSWKYFLENFESFKSLLVNNFEKQINEYICKLKKEKNNIPIVSVHFRRTDYIKNPDFHLNLDIGYYIKAFEYFDKEKTLFLFFSDDIEWVKNQDFNFLKNKIFVEENNEEYTLWLMSKCEHNIIANSSFSLWASYLNENPNKKIISPSRWFGYKGPNYNINDIVLVNTIIVDV